MQWKSDQRLNLTIPVVVRKVSMVYCSGDMENHFAQLANCYGDTFYNPVPVRHKRGLIPAPIIHRCICLMKTDCAKSISEDRSRERDNSFAASAFQNPFRTDELNELPESLTITQGNEKKYLK